MDPAPENFDKLQKLLALKRHEQPPHGFFERFPAQVRARIAGPQREPSASWWQRLLETLDARPMLAGAYGLAVGGALLLAVNFLVKPEPAPSFTQQPPQPVKDSIVQPMFAPGQPVVAFGDTNFTPSNGTPPAFLTTPGEGNRAVAPASANFRTNNP
ncbi:MAG: hypothetical protein HY300_15880 [Verrucomicrobia bacterium]|nr:hypothetical protein [Verrucomicrobiota bacterium]